MMYCQYIYIYIYVNPSGFQWNGRVVDAQQAGSLVPWWKLGRNHYWAFRWVSVCCSQIYLIKVRLFWQSLGTGSQSRFCAFVPGSTVYGQQMTSRKVLSSPLVCCLWMCIVLTPQTTKVLLHFWSGKLLFTSFLSHWLSNMSISFRDSSNHSRQSPWNKPADSVELGISEYQIGPNQNLTSLAHADSADLWSSPIWNWDTAKPRTSW